MDIDNIENGYVPPYQDGVKVNVMMHKRVWIKTLDDVSIGMEATVCYGKDYWKLVDKSLMLKSDRNLGDDGGRENKVCVFMSVFVKR